MSRTVIIRHSSGPLASVPLTLIGETEIVAYLGCSWDNLPSPGSLKRKQFHHHTHQKRYTGADVWAWVKSLGYAPVVILTPDEELPAHNKNHTTGND